MMKITTKASWKPTQSNETVAGPIEHTWSLS